jgi:hypothetical protein
MLGLHRQRHVQDKATQILTLPGVRPTLTLLSPKTALSRDDFPTLGCPIRPIVSGTTRGAPSASSEGSVGDLDVDESDVDDLGSGKN